MSAEGEGVSSGAGEAGGAAAGSTFGLATPPLVPNFFFAASPLVAPRAPPVRFTAIGCSFLGRHVLESHVSDRARGHYCRERRAFQFPIRAETSACAWAAAELQTHAQISKRR